jgi:hypothetical protein
MTTTTTSTETAARRLDALHKALEPHEVIQQRRAAAKHVLTMTPEMRAMSHEQRRKRLQAALRELRTMGFMARANYKCCGGCATAAMPDEYPDARAYFMWHHQSDERMKDGKNLYVMYGSAVKQPIPDTATPEERAKLEKSPNYVDHDDVAELIGHLAVQVLTKHGVPTWWNGLATDCIVVVFDVNALEKD